MKKLILLITVILLTSCSWVNEANQVAKEEFGARGSLKKYEWFKDAAATIEEKAQTILVYEENIKSMKSEYGGIKRRDWDRLDRQQFNQWYIEIAGLKANYNSIVKEYNAQSSKFNWEAYNTSTLPRELNAYLSK